MFEVIITATWVNPSSSFIEEATKLIEDRKSTVDPWIKSQQGYVKSFTDIEFGVVVRHIIFDTYQNALKYAKLINNITDDTTLNNKKLNELGGDINAKRSIRIERLA